MKINTASYYWLVLLFVACLVRSSSAGTCVRIQDAPVADIHIKTCENTPNLQYSFNQNYMTVTSSLETCQNADEAGTSSSSVYFNVPLFMEYHYQHTFQYTIMATDVDAHCVVTLIAGEPKNLTDQNGLPNDPLQDISKFALNQWYTRKFTLNNTIIGPNRFVRLGLTCATSTPISDGITTQTVLIRDIRFVSNSYYNSAKVVYNYQVCQSGCDLTTISGVQCMPASDGSAVWTYPNNLTEPIVKTAAPLAVLGDVETSNLWLASSMNITGCLKAMDSTGVTVHLPPSRNITVYHKVGCMLPRLNFNIDINPEYTGLPISSPYDSTCPHQFFPENVVVTMDNDRVTFFAGSNTVKELCKEAIYAPQVASVPKVDHSVETALVVVFSVVGAVAIFLAVFFGVRKYREQKTNKSLTGVEVPLE